jgi:hypothetical protein
MVVSLRLAPTVGGRALWRAVSLAVHRLFVPRRRIRAARPDAIPGAAAAYAWLAAALGLSGMTLALVVWLLAAAIFLRRP